MARHGCALHCCAALISKHKQIFRSLSEDLLFFSVSWTVTIVLSALGALLVLALFLFICYCYKSRNGNGGHKKKQTHSFGLRKNYFKDRLNSNKPAMQRCNPTPVSNPSKGHYLKKTPSPTGQKSPPGIHNGNQVEETRKPLLTNIAMTAGHNGDLILSGQDSVDHHHHPVGGSSSITSQMVGTLRRSSSGHILEVTAADANQVLGMLHCTIRYSFDKNALVVTVSLSSHFSSCFVIVYSSVRARALK